MIMAIFIGTYQEFDKFIGGYARNKVQQLTKKTKLSKNNFCDHCGKKTNNLDSAHMRGMERKIIMESILNTFHKDANGNYVVDLNMFEKDFINHHMPIEEHFYFLCKKCHKLYDSSENNMAKKDKHLKSIIVDYENNDSYYKIPDEYKRMKTETIQDFIKRILTTLFAAELISKEEIELLKDKKYCKKTFFIGFPLLTEKIEEISFSGHNRYWTSKKFGGKYYVCKEWWKQNFNIYEEKIYNWINKLMK